jgi:cytidine deaminase
MVRLEREDELIEAARKARENAHTPYSHFKVGAAILDTNGTIHTGCNIENASYSLSVCAERVAIYKAVSQGVKSFQAIAIVADTEEAVSPCGACCQVLAEFSREMIVIMASLSGNVVYSTVEDLLPYAFTPKKLEEAGYKL